MSVRVTGSDLYLALGPEACLSLETLRKTAGLVFEGGIRYHMIEKSGVGCAFIDHFALFRKTSNRAEVKVFGFIGF
ncbi:MAG: hypothetical protein HUK24_07485 [Sphaerochaetaceae bacterium]|nr:hypothetical protein [Sphaerochaetaceae bacterium]